MTQVSVEEVVKEIAAQTGAPKETVSKMYAETLAAYREGARFMDYVPVLAARRVREDLRKGESEH
jgi:uncharacterized protein DUF3562